MLKPGEIKEIAGEIIKFGYNIVALQEIRWQGHGQMDMPQYSLLYSGPDRRIG